MFKMYERLLKELWLVLIQKFVTLVVVLEKEPQRWSWETSSKGGPVTSVPSQRVAHAQQRGGNMLLLCCLLVWV